MSIILTVKRKKPSPKRKSAIAVEGSSEVAALIRKLETEIARDEKTRAEATARIASNKELLKAAYMVSPHLSDAKKTRKAPPPAEPEVIEAPHHGNGSDALPAAETTKPLPAKLPRGGGAVGIVLAVLQGHPDGLPAPELKRMASIHSDAPTSLKEHGQYIYSILDTLKMRGQAEKGADGKWRATKVAAGTSAATH